jgi:hypothetical protein
VYTETLVTDNVSNVQKGSEHAACQVPACAAARCCESRALNIHRREQAVPEDAQALRTTASGFSDVASRCNAGCPGLEITDFTVHQRFTCTLCALARRDSLSARTRRNNATADPAKLWPQQTQRLCAQLRRGPQASTSAAAEAMCAADSCRLDARRCYPGKIWRDFDEPFVTVPRNSSVHVSSGTAVYGRGPRDPRDEDQASLQQRESPAAERNRWFTACAFSVVHRRLVFLTCTSRGLWHDASARLRQQWVTSAA